MDWDRTHAWIVRRCRHYRTALLVSFSAEEPSARELIAARKLSPEFSSEPPARFRERIRAGRLDLGVMPAFDARRIVKLATSLGLSLEPTASVELVYLFEDRTTGGTLVVEDVGEAERIAAEMAGAGFPVVDVETD